MLLVVRDHKLKLVVEGQNRSEGLNADQALATLQLNLVLAALRVKVSTAKQELVILIDELDRRQQRRKTHVPKHDCADFVRVKLGNRQLHITVYVGRLPVQKLEVESCVLGLVTNSHDGVSVVWFLGPD